MEAVPPMATAAGALLAWQAAASLWHVPTVLLPSPVAVGSRLIEEWPHLLADASVTCGEAVAAFALALAAGVGIATLMTLRPGTRQALQPHLVLFQLVPKVALGPLFITWFGLGWSSRIAFAMFVSAFPVAIGALAGFGRVDRPSLQMLLACRASTWQIFRHLRLPGALPYIFAGAKVAATMAFTGATVGEFPVGAIGPRLRDPQRGLGLRHAAGVFRAGGCCAYWARPCTAPSRWSRPGFGA